MTTDMTLEQLAELFGYTLKRRRLTTAEAAEVLGIKPNTLEIKRTYGNGPNFVKPKGSKHVWYLERDLLEYLAAGRHKSTSQRAPISVQ